MTTLSLRYVLVFIVSLAVFRAAAAVGAPSWLAMLAAGLACTAAVALPELVRRLRGRERRAPPPDPRRFRAALAERLRLFAADRELGERGVHITIGSPAADIAALFGAAGFTRETLAMPGGPSWSLWRRRGLLCLEIPAEYLDESADAAWQVALAVLPRRLLRTWARGAIVVVPWTALESTAPATLDRHTELVRDRLRSFSRRIGLALPVHVAFASAGDPPLGPLLAPPLQLDGTRPWGVRLPFTRDPDVCRRAAHDELEALTAAFAARVVEDLGAAMDIHKDMSSRTSRPGDLLPLIARLRRLAGPAEQFLATLLAGAPNAQTIWPRSLFLTGAAPPTFSEGLFAEIAADTDLARPNAAAQRSRRRLHAAAGLALSGALAVAGVLALHVYREDQKMLEKAQQVIVPRLPTGPAALPRLKALHEVLEALAGFDPTPRLFAGLASTDRIVPGLRGFYTNSVHHSLFIPTLDRARARLCPGRGAPLDDQASAALDALLQLYVLGTRGEPSPGELELLKDHPRVDAVVAAGVDAAWAGELSVDTLDTMRTLLTAHLRDARSLQVRREDSCVREAQERLRAWRAHACSPAGLSELVQGTSTLRDLLSSKHIAAVADPDDHQIPKLYTVEGLDALRRAFDPATRRCGPGGFAFGNLQRDERIAAEEARRALFAGYADSYVGDWQRLLREFAPAPLRRGCDDLPVLLAHLSAADGPLRKLPETVATFAVPAIPDPPDGAWYRTHEAKIREALQVYTEAGRQQIDGKKPVIDDIVAGLGELHGLLGDSLGRSDEEATSKLDVAKAQIGNACTQLDSAAAAQIEDLLQPLYSHVVRCVERGGSLGLNPWCAEVVAPFARGLGGAYPFDPNTRRDVRLDDLCTFYCPDKGAALSYHRQRLAAVLLDLGNGRYVGNPGHGFVSFDSYNPALAQFYARTWRLSNLLFPTGDGAQPTLRLSVYIPPIDQPGVEVEEVALELDGQVAAFTNARARSRDLVWPGGQKGDAVLRIRGRYNGQKFDEELPETGAWALFRLLERASDAAWSGDHLRFRFKLGKVHDLAVDLELDAGPANELLLDRKGNFLPAFRARDVAPPLRLRRHGDPCPR